MKNLVVYSLWGDDPKYWIGAKNNIELVKNHFPNWICRFYIDNNCSQELINTLVSENVEIVMMDSGNYNYRNISERFNHNGLFWRFIPLSEDDVDVVLSRDCDSRFTEREVLAINEWLQSDKNFHIMRDHPYHRVPILAGMWGARKGILKNINQLLQYWNQYTNKGRFHAEDQDFLGQIVYPIVINNSFEHSEFGISYGNQIHNFPIERQDYEFIGDVYDENDQRHPDYWKIIESVS